MSVVRTVATVGFSLTAACTIADIPDPAAHDVAAVTNHAPGSSAPLACAPTTGAPVDTTQLAKCDCKSGGSARCVPSAMIPSALSSQLDTCNGGGCVPDTVLAAPDRALPGCKAKGVEGRCLSMCVPLVAKYADTFLSRGDGDVCPSDERCVPCDSPLDGTSTGVCQIGQPAAAACAAPAPAVATAAQGTAIVQTPAPPSTLKDCCEKNGQKRGKCVAPSAVSDDLRERLSERECDSGELCAPNASVDPDAKPVTCGGGFGVCVSDCVALGLGDGRLLDLGECQSDEACVACTPTITGGRSSIPGCT
jgi:hypothetical protein